MKLLENFIKYDKQLTEICDFFNDENIQQLEENNKNRMVLSTNLLRGFKKISVFEYENKIYKVLPLESYKELEAIYKLVEIFNLSSFILNHEIEYNGKNIVIISQEKIEIFKSSNRIDEFLEDNNINYVNNLKIKSKLLNNINIYLKNFLKEEEYENFLKLIDFLKVYDLNTPSNFGKKNNKIFCVDLENHNQNIGFYDLKVFLEENNKNFIEIVNEYPELFYLIKR